jgi:hypothetical protein
MKLTGIQRKLLLLLVASLILSAALAIMVVLTGDLGDAGGRVLGTSVALAGFSLTGMAAAIPVKKPALAFIRPTGLAASVVGFACVAWFIWADDIFDTSTINLAKVLAIAIVVSVAAAHAGLLARGYLRDARVDFVVSATLVCNAVISFIIIASILAEDFSEGIARILGVLAILAVLGTLLTPILPRVLSINETTEN